MESQPLLGAASATSVRAAPTSTPPSLPHTSHLPPLPPPPTSHHTTLSLRERKLKNLHKRVKLHSKRLRAHWPAVAAFLDVQSTVALASTCRRMQQILQDDSVWQSKLTAVHREKWSHAVLSDQPQQQRQQQAATSAKQRLQQLIHARHVLDPTNSLEQRLRDAERAEFQAKMQQLKIRELFQIVACFAFVLCCISIYGFATDNTTGSIATSAPTARRESNKHHVNQAKTFTVALDVLCFAIALLLGAGVAELTENLRASVVLLALLECARMAFTALAVVPTTNDVLHAVCVFVAVVVVAVATTRKQHDVARAVATFKGNY